MRRRSCLALVRCLSHGAARLSVEVLRVTGEKEEAPEAHAPPAQLEADDDIIESDLVLAHSAYPHDDLRGVLVLVEPDASPHVHVEQIRDRDRE